MLNARGTRDISGGDAILRQRVVQILKSVFELYGFSPLETPALERYDTLASKYAGGEEILKEVFRLKDQGKRDLALRYDLTVPLARFIAMNPTLKMPFKRYAIGNVFRDGPVKLGRYREFTQCDVDVIGAPSMSADAEMVKIALSAFEMLGLDVAVRVNNRKLLDAVLEKAGVASEKLEAVILSIDKLEKLGRDAVESELKGKGIAPETIARIMQFIAIRGNNQDTLAKLGKIVGDSEGLKEIAEVLGITGNRNVRLDPSLARGLAYYTGSVFEAFLSDSEIKSSVAAGGRYDGMIGGFVGGQRAYPAVGISFGLDVISDAIKVEKGRAPSSVVKAFVIAIGEPEKAAEFVELLRKSNVSCDADYSGKVTKAIEYASSYGIPYAVFIGKKEAAAGKVKLRDLSTGKETLMAVRRAVSYLAKGGVS